jgi:hypothetical protein
MQLDATLEVLFALASRPGWLVLFLLVLIEGEIPLYHLVSGVGMAHLPTLVLSMAGVKWKLRGWTEGLAVPLKV